MPIMPGNPFKGRHYSGEVILFAVRWYLRYPLVYEHVAEMLAELGLAVRSSSATCSASRPNRVYPLIDYGRSASLFELRKWNPMASARAGVSARRSNGTVPIDSQNAASSSLPFPANPIRGN